MEGVFSSSMYASSNQMCKRESPKAGHLCSLKELAVGHFQWAAVVYIGRSVGYTGSSTPCVRCSRVGHVSSFESRVLNSNGHLRTTGHDQVRIGRVRYSPVSYAESSANRDLTGLVHREGCKTPSHRTHTTRRTQSIRCSQSDTLYLS